MWGHLLTVLGRTARVFIISWRGLCSVVIKKKLWTPIIKCYIRSLRLFWQFYNTELWIYLQYYRVMPPVIIGFFTHYSLCYPSIGVRENTVTMSVWVWTVCDVNPDIRTGLYATVTDGKIRDIIRKFMNSIQCFTDIPQQRDRSQSRRRRGAGLALINTREKKKSQAGIHIV